ncbi:MAG: amino acid adenylation domain-containing protein [Aestuariibacter sp.]
MKIAEIIQACKQQGVRLGIKADKLLLEETQGPIQPALLQHIKENKSTLLGLFSSQSDGVEVVHHLKDYFQQVSHNQQRFWLLQQLTDNSSQSHIAKRIDIKGDYCVNTIERVLHTLVSRHQILRTVYRFDDDNGLTQHLLDKADMTITRIDNASQEIAEEGFKNTFNQPFHLDKDIPIRACLAQLSDNHLQLLIVTHHIAIDGWSFGIIAKEFVALYQDFTAGNAAQLPKMEHQYIDYVHWLRQQDESGQLTEQQAYWQQQLADLPEFLPLNQDFPHPAVPVGNCFTFTTRWTQSTCRLLQHHCQQQDLTHYMVLQTLFNSFISRWSQQSDVLVGSVSMGRIEKEFESVVGCFINDLVIRSKFTESTTFAESLVETKETILKAFEYQSGLQNKGKNSLQARSFDNLFNVLFVLQNNPATSLELPNLWITEQAYDVSEFAQSKVDIELYATETNDHIEFKWVFNGDIFVKDTAESIVNAFDLFASEALKDIAQKVATIPLQTPPEKQLAALNTSATENCYQTFVDGCRENLLQTAIQTERNNYTYGQLIEKAEYYASWMSAQGIGSQQVVALRLEKSIELVALVFASMKLGAGFLLLDKRQPQQRLDYMLEQSQTTMLLCDDEFSTSIPVRTCHIADISVAKKPLAKVNTCASPKLAYLVFTSGSTGQPKGVMINHHNLQSYLSSINQTYQDLTGCRLPSCASIGFDIFIEEMLMPLFNQGTLLLSDIFGQSSINDFWQGVISHKVTGMTLPTAMFHTLVDNLTPEHSIQLPNILKFLVLGGEALSLGVLSKWQSLTNCAVNTYNSYGPTETTIIATCANVTHYQQIDLNYSPIGQATPNCQLVILDKHQQLCAPGMEGELYIGGDAVGPGYLQNQQLNEERFVHLPQIAEGRFYRTGDLVKQQQNGQLYFCRREDSQIKLNGFRVELNEVQYQLERISGINTAYVTLAGGQDHKYLVAYVASRNGWSTDIYRSKLQNTLPVYMLPGNVIELPAMPLTINGKVDTKALPEFTNSGIKPAAETQLEKRMQTLWCQLFERSDIGVDEDFINLGGTSLLGMKLLGRIETQMGFRISLKVLLQNSSIRTLCLFLTQQGMDVADKHRIIVKSTAPTTILSPAQNRLWFISQQHPESPQYNIYYAMSLTGELSVELINRCLQTLLQRHEILRTRFVTVAGLPQQVVDGDRCIAADYVTLPLNAPEEQDQFISQLLKEEFLTPFDLANDVLLRCKLIRCAQHRHVLSICMHHIVADGWSMQLLTHEFFTLYKSFLQGESNPLPELEIQYSDYVHWIQQQEEVQNLQQQQDYWQKQLAQLPVLHDLPTIQPRPRVKQNEGSAVSGHLSAHQAVALQELAKQFGLTPFMLLHSALCLVLARHSNSSDIVIGTPVANRPLPQLSSVIGFFVNTLVLRVNTLHQDLHDYLNHVKQVHLDAQANQDVPIEQLVENQNVARSTSYNPLFQILLTTENEFGAGEETHNVNLPGVEIAPVNTQVKQARFDIETNMALSEQGLSLQWIYDCALFDEAQIQSLCDHLLNLLSQLATLKHHQKVPLGSLDFLSESETRYLLELNNNSAEYSSDLPIHALFERQVSKTPDEIALIFGQQHMDYKSLDCTANQLAHFLREEFAIVPGARIGICIERSMEMPLAILAILKAGCVYVPLDPNLPQKRLDFILQDADLSLVLCFSKLLNKLENFAGKWLCIDNIASDTSGIENLGDYPEESPSITPVRISGSDQAYIIYTSGSTGHPKGVCQRHKTIVNLLTATVDFNRPLDTLQFTPFSFDVSLQEIFTALLSGSTLKIIAQNVKDDLQVLFATIQRERIARLFIPPVLLEHLAKHRLPHLRQIYVAGMKLTLTKDVTEFLEKNPACDLYNHYGPTETHVVTSHKVLSTDPLEPPIGKAVANTNLYICSPLGQLVPYGSVGELWVSGAGIAAGYLNRPELTAERFIPDTFNRQATARKPDMLYKTGDLVRYLPDGNLSFVGRSDDQVKIRGFRVELGEIENQLTQLENIDSSLVLMQTYNDVDQLVAWVKARGVQDENRFVAETETRLSERLPEYMLPWRFVIVEEWPLTPNGKIDKSKLPEPSRLGQSLMEYVPPQTPAEKTLVSIWSEFLNLPTQKISVQASFFELGGTSLIMMPVVKKAEESGLNFTVTDMMTNQTIRTICQQLEQQGTSQYSRPLDCIVKLNNNSSDQAVFMIHHINGRVDFYEDFARLFEDDYAVYGVQAAYLNDQNMEFSSYEELARFYVAQIKEVCPNGPYRLAGWSLGGEIAFAIASILADQGATIEYLGIIDSDAPVEEHATNQKPVIQLLKDNLQFLRSSPRFTAELDVDKTFAQINVERFSQLSLNDQIDHVVVIASSGDEKNKSTWNELRLAMKFVVQVQLAERFKRKFHHPVTVDYFVARPQKVSLYAPTEESLLKQISGWRSLFSGPMNVSDMYGNHLTLFYDESVVSHIHQQMAKQLGRAKP